MPVEREVQLLNIDLLLVGRFDRKPLLAALNKRVLVVHDDAEFDNEPCLTLELLESDLDFAKTLARLLKWVEGLPPTARRSWAAASRRVFDIGIQAGKRPHETHWTIRQDQVATLAKLGAEVMLTVYGAEWARHAVASGGSRKPASPAR